MMRFNGLLVSLLLATLISLSCVAANATEIPIDLMGGIGGFEWSPIDDDTGDDYDEVAIGWSKELYSGSLPDGAHYIYLIDDGDVFGTDNCQYIGVTNPDEEETAGVFIRWGIGRDWESCPLEDGDEVTFSLEHIKMSGYSEVTCNYYLCLEEVRPGGSDYECKLLTKSTTDFSDYVTRTVTSDGTYLKAYVMLYSEDTGEHEPGIYVDGAELTFTRDSATQMEEQPPVTKQWNVKLTDTHHLDPETHDTRYVAEHYDSVFLRKEYTWWGERLRYYDPDIKIIWGQSAGVSDRRVGEYEEITAIWCDPFSFLDVKDNHSEWLYDYDPEDEEDPFLETIETYYPEGDPRTPSWRQVPYMFNMEYIDYYEAHLDSSTYQQAWLADAVADMNQYHCDGLFIDSPGTVPTSLLPPYGRPASESQEFLNVIIEGLRVGGNALTWKSGSPRAYVIANFCAHHLDDVDWSSYPPWGRPCFDPWFDGDEDEELYPDCLDNDGDGSDVPDGFFQEWAFFSALTSGNAYDEYYRWLRCLNDMDEVEDWNASLGSDYKKYVHIQICGTDATDDPAYGMDGWLRFGLCSYLLGQNDWTTISFNLDGGVEPELDLDVTNDLAEPANEHAQVGANTYLHNRTYYGDDGAKGGLVVVNGYDDYPTKTYSVTRDCVDENDRFLPRLAQLTLLPNTGRILLNENDYKYTSVLDYPEEGAVIPSGTGAVIEGYVYANRDGLSRPSTVQVKVDDGEWSNLSCYGTPWFFDDAWFGSAGKHTMYTRVYVNGSDYEPDKAGRNFFKDDTTLTECDTVAEAIELADDDYVKLTGMRVTSTNEYISGSIYIQDPDMTNGMVRGIRVEYSDSAPKVVEVGETANVIGTMDTVDGQRCITDAIVMLADSAKADPYVFIMSNRTLGGGDWEYNSGTGAGQRGISTAYGWNNIGNLISTWGVVDSIDSSSFYIDDGSGVSAGVSVKVVVPSGVTVPDDEDFVAVVGLSCCEVDSTLLKRLIRVRQQSDIVDEDLGADDAEYDVYYGLQTVSSPLVPLDSDPVEVFDPWDIEYTETLTRYRVPYGYNETYDYLDPVIFGNIVVDDGYWLDLDGTDGEYAGTVEYTGIDAQRAVDSENAYVCVSLPGLQFDQSDSGGDHILGFPLNSSYDINSQGQSTGDRVLFSDGELVEIWSQAYSAGWCGRMMYRWDGDTQIYRTAGYQYVNETSFTPGCGYKFETDKDDLVMMLEVPED